MTKQHPRLRWIPVLAGLVAAILLATGSTVAWFYNRHQIAAVSAIRPPNAFLIKDGQGLNDPLCIPKIDLSEGREYQFFFSVVGSGEYIIQIGYTTNVPYSFALYELERGDSGNCELVCNDKSGTSYFNFATPKENILTRKLNPGANQTAVQGSTLANGTYATYGSSDSVQINAEPIYEQTAPRSNPEESGDSESITYYLLDICWNIDASELAKYNEESDMIYIVAGSAKTGGGT